MGQVAWETSHSVDTRAGLPAAWAYMTNVSNWEDPPATFELHGPFAAGSSGATRMPGQEPLRWRLAEVNQLKSYLLETELDRALLTFRWRFDAIAGGTRLTQHIMLSGENAPAYAAQVAAAFASNLAAGMTKIAAAIERAENLARPQQ
jgi:hypothetical protein